MRRACPHFYEIVHTKATGWIWLFPGLRIVVDIEEESCCVAASRRVGMGEEHRVELLAPAGNAEGFYGAVHAGADAVYLAGERFGARAYAENCTADEIVACIRYAHLMGRKVYLTVNTLLKDPELEELYDYLLPFYEAGLDAVIVQDLGVLRFIREHFPKLKIHVSTQMTLCSGYGAKLLKSMGASRIVPARELSLRELRVMKEESGIETEAFVHGAMCYCYSGQCLFSSILGGRSGNRGRCAQPCRLPYSVNIDGKRVEDSYLLSLKDMCTIQHIPKLAEAGIDSFKIEGRMKKPEYAAGVTQIYRRYIDRYYELREKKGTEEAQEAYRMEMKEKDFREDTRRLNSLYIRSEVQDGYYFRRNGREMISMDSPAYRPVNDILLEEIRGKYLETRLKLPVTVKAVFQPGQPAELVMQCAAARNAEGQFTARAVVKGAPVERAVKQPVMEENIRKQLGRLGDSAFWAEETEVVLDEDCFYPLKAINELRRTAVAELERQILTAGGYGDAALYAGDDRKTGQEPLTDGGPAAERSSFAAERADFAEPFGNFRKGYALSLCTQEQAEALAEWLAFHPMEDPVRFYIDGDLILREKNIVEALCRRFSASGEVYAALPYILREEDGQYLRRLFELAAESRWIHGFLVRSMDGLGFLEDVGNGMPCRTDAGVYVWNQAAANELAPRLCGFCLPYELNASEQRSLLKGRRNAGRLCGTERRDERQPCGTKRRDEGQSYKNVRAGQGVGGLSCGAERSWEKIVYSRIPMMVTANCLFRTAGKCRRQISRGKASHNDPDRHIVSLTDRYHREFPVMADCRHCVNIIYNSVPLSLHRELEKWRGIVDLRIDFTLETRNEVKQILDSFVGGGPFPQQEYTTGHEKRGAE